MSPDAASKHGVTCLHGVREPGGVARRGVKNWRHLLARHQRARWHVQMWRQNVASLACVASGSHAASLELYQGSCHWPRLASEDVASERGVTCSRGAIDLRGVAGRGVNTWRQEAQASRHGHVSSKCVFRRRVICAPPQATTLFTMISIIAFWMTLPSRGRLSQCRKLNLAPGCPKSSKLASEQEGSGEGEVRQML